VVGILRATFIFELVEENVFYPRKKDEVKMEGGVANV